MLLFCGVCYMCLSIWAIIQLFIMGILYRVESLGLIEDVEAHHAKSLQDFLDKTSQNYAKVGNNCFIAGAIYVVILVGTYFCVKLARNKAAVKQERLLDDDISCTFEVKELTAKEKRKIK